jgi:hypothetical protein
MSRASRRLRKRELADAVVAMSELEQLDAAELEAIDLIICVLGFEERALAMPAELAGSGTAVGATAVVRYLTNPEDNERNWPAMRESLLQLDDGEPAKLQAGSRLARDLRALVDGLPQSRPRVAWDVSVASNDLIVDGLAALIDCDVELTLLYAEARDYRPSREEFENERERFVGDGQMGLDDGVLEVEVAGEFPGAHSPRLAHELICFPGFSRDRVRSTISKVDPEWIVTPERAPLVWMIGRPPHADLQWRTAALRAIHDVDSYGAADDVHELNTLDYRETLQVLDKHYGWRGGEVNLTISALGSKMQAVGIALFCTARPDVRVIFARPELYNAGAYTGGIRALWRLPLGPTVELKDSLRRVGTLEIVDDDA